MSWLPRVRIKCVERLVAHSRSTPHHSLFRSLWKRSPRKTRVSTAYLSNNDCIRSTSLSADADGMKIPALRKWLLFPKCQSAMINVLKSGSSSARSGNSVKFVSINRITFPICLSLQLGTQFFQPRLPILVAIALPERLREDRKSKRCQLLWPLHDNTVCLHSSECLMHP